MNVHKSVGSSLFIRTCFFFLINFNFDLNIQLGASPPKRRARGLKELVFLVLAFVCICTERMENIVSACSWMGINANGGTLSRKWASSNEGASPALSYNMADCFWTLAQIFDAFLFSFSFNIFY